jgi:antitoxin component HigA of HigAB toxin-antitoxin module
MSDRAPDPVALLEAHLAKTKRNANQFAIAAGIDPTMITRALARERGLGLRSAIKTDRESDGDVPVEAWEHFVPKKRGGSRRSDRRKTA